MVFLVSSSLSGIIMRSRWQMKRNFSGTVSPLATRVARGILRRPARVIVSALMRINVVRALSVGIRVLLRRQFLR